MSTQNITATPGPDVADRIGGAVWGQFVGDAFCLGSHWIYDLTELERRFPGGPRGFEEPAAGHYHFGKKPGDLTHYGDGALLLLRSLRENRRFDVQDFGSRFVSMTEAPEYKGYRDHAARGTVENYRAYRAQHPDGVYGYQDGPDDDQPAGITRLAPLVALYYREADLPGIVDRATRVCHNNDRAVAYNRAHAMILRELFSGGTLDAAAGRAAEQVSRLGAGGAEAAEKIDAALAGRDLPVREATMKFGQSCPLAGSFPAALQCAVHHRDDFAAALRASSAAGGDNAARGAMIGSWLGASLGIKALPPQWCETLAARDEIAGSVRWLIETVSGK